MLSLQAAHPGVLLLVEVGYKMRMFGQDAEVAAKVMQLTALGAEVAATAQDCARCAPTHAQLPAGPHAWRFSNRKALQSKGCLCILRRVVAAAAAGTGHCLFL